MLTQLSYKHKFFAVLVGFVILLFASYKKNFKQLFVVKNELVKIKSNLNNSDDLFIQVNNLENEINVIDAIIGGNTKNPSKVQQMILDFVSNKKFKTNIVSIDDVHLNNDNNFLVYTNQIEFEGKYEELLKLFYQIEKEFNSSLIINANMYSKKNYRTNVKNLYLKIIFQNYEKIK